MASTAAEVFGESLNRARRGKALSQKRLAAIAGLSMTFIGQMERGLKLPGLEATIKLAQALDLSVPDLLAGFTREWVKSFRW